MSFADTNADTNADPRQCTPGTPGMCHENATCTQVTPHVCACNPVSSYRCECNQGYTGDGLNCTGESKVSIVISNITKFSFVSGITWLVLVETIKPQTNASCRLFYFTNNASLFVGVQNALGFLRNITRTPLLRIKH